MTIMYDCVNHPGEPADSTAAADYGPPLCDACALGYSLPGCGELDLDARPPVVCLCGTTRAMEQITAVAVRETLAGRIVVRPEVDLHSPHLLDVAAAAASKTDLDRLHLRKIDLADEVLVIAPNGYIGESTRREIEYATARGKRVRVEQVSVGSEVLR